MFEAKCVVGAVHAQLCLPASVESVVRNLAESCVVLTRLLLSRRLVTFDLSTITALEPESRWGGVSRRFGERLASGRIDPPSSTTPRGSPPPRQQTGLADQLHALSYALKHPEQR